MPPRLVRSIRFALALALSTALLAACDDAPTAPSHFAPFTQGDLRVGSGAEAGNGSVVSVHYTGWLFNATQPEEKGAVFDTSRGLQPFVFTLGAGQVIAGWDRGLVGMKVGGLRRLVIPPSLAYGPARNGPIPPNATLIFEIELLAVE